MSYPVMPPMPLSMAKGLKKTPNFNSVGQKTAAALGNSFISLKPYPTWDFEFDLDHVTGNEAAASSVVAEFLSIFMQCNGQAGLFLFTDPQDNTVTNMPFGTGDGTTVAFQLSRTIGGTAVDVIQNLNGTPTIYVNGTPTSSLSVSATGVVTFVSAPAAAAVLTWTGNFYYLCRFDADTVDSTRSFTINSGMDQWMFNAIKFSSEFVTSSTSGTIGSGTVVLSVGQLPVLQNPTGNQTISTYGLVLPFIVGNVQDATSSPTVQLIKGSTGIWYLNGSSGGGISVRQFTDAHSRVALGNNGSSCLLFGDGTNVPDVGFNYTTGLLTLAQGSLAVNHDLYEGGSGNIYANQLEDNHSSPTMQIKPGSGGTAGSWAVVVPSGGGFSMRHSGDTADRVSLLTGVSTGPSLSLGGGSTSPDIIFIRSIFASTSQPYLSLLIDTPDELGFQIWRKGEANPRFDIGTTTTGDYSAIYFGPGGSGGLDLGIRRYVDPNGVLNFGFHGAANVTLGLGIFAGDPTLTSWGSTQAGRLWFDTTNNLFRWFDGTNPHTVVGRDTTDTLTNKTLTSPTLTGTTGMASATMSGTLTSYNGQTTAGVGAVVILAAYDATAQAANIGSTNLITSGNMSTNMLLEVSAEWIVTTVASGGTPSSTLPTLNLQWTNPDNSTAQSTAVGPSNTLEAGAGGSATTNSLTTRGQAVVVANCKSGTALSFTTSGYASAGTTAMQYALHIRVKRVG